MAQVGVGTAPPVDDDLEAGRAIVRGQRPAGDPSELLALAARLVDRHEFGVARRLLRRAREGSLKPADARRARHAHALCTYKDPDLPRVPALRHALEILAEGEDLATTSDRETLNLAGAIHKRRWEATMRTADLQRALGYYQRSYQQGIGDGQGAINAAFVLDLLADVDEGPDGPSSDGDAGDVARRRNADAIRRQIIEALSAEAERRAADWWLQATLAEAHFGLGEYGEAQRWLIRCRDIAEVPEWMFEVTARQIGALAMLRARTADGDLRTEAKAALTTLLGHRAGAVTRSLAGKLGVALSGGGFRAALFHIGLLAHLAEIDALRHVEVLSCVSGGSIVGAYYYLEVQRLLEEKDEADITRHDYIGIVERMEKEFLTGVQSNIRMRVVGNLPSTLLSILWPRWTRTRIAGRQYERRLYARIPDTRRRLHMYDLLVAPKGEQADASRRFNPKRDNWRRRCKVPILVFNAATLNTGHNWQFTATWMGEPPTVVDEDIDVNPRLRRMYYREAPKRWQKVRLGDAVAASACVPGMFEPFVMQGLYDGAAVQLVDGGVHDNQGIASLLEQECAVMIVSDASGQMEHDDVLGTGPLAAPLRSGSVLGARVREAQLRDLLARRSSSALRGLAIIHLRKGLGEPPRDWVDCPDPYVPEDDIVVADEADYGIRPEIQARLAALRTDLDTFSDLEAHALMLSGYRMAQSMVGEALGDLPLAAPPANPEWRFLSVEPALDSAHADHARLKRVLDVGAERWLKPWRLCLPLRVVGVVLAVVLAVLAVWGLWQVRDIAILTPGAVLAIGVALVGIALLTKVGLKRVDPVGTAFRALVGIALVLATIPAWFQILVLDRVYRRAGRRVGI